MLHIGCHLSVSKGYLHMGKEAMSLGADTFQFFTRNPRGGKAAVLKPGDVEALNRFRREHGFAPVVAHAPYTLNPCGADEKVRSFALQSLDEDMTRLAAVEDCYYNLHPGCHVGQGVEKGIELIADALRQTLLKHPDSGTVVLLETMAGKGSEVGGRFEELRAIIDAVDIPERMGVCLDTCHVFDGGYDIVDDLDGVLARFDEVIGLDRLRAIHLNDSLNPFGSHKDRHARLEEGNIGIEALVRVATHPVLRHLPFILETPNEFDGYAREIRLMRERYEQQ